MRSWWATVSASGAQASKVGRRVAWSAISRRSIRTPAVLLHEPNPDGIDSVVWAIDGPAMVDPLHGYVFDDRHRVHWDALAPNWRTSRPPWRYATPSPREYRAALRNHRKVVEVEAAVLLRDPYEWNYFHFHFDVLGRLELLDSVVAAPDLPLIMGRYVDDLSFTQQVLSIGSLQQRNVLVQDETWVRAERIYGCRTGHTFRRRSDYVQDLMGLTNPGGTDARRRVFLTRSPGSTRVPTNLQRVHDAVEALGFEVIDTATLDVRAQIELFRNTRSLIALHGAGLANIVYRRGRPFSMLEIHSTEYGYNSDFSLICAQYGFDHRSLACKPEPSGNSQHANYVVDTAQLRREADQLLAMSDG